MRNLMPQFRPQSMLGGRKTTSLLQPVLVLLVTLLLTTTAWAAQVRISETDSASSFFSSTDGCIQTQAGASLTDTHLKSNPDGSTVESHQFNIFINQSDLCSGTSISFITATGLVDDDLISPNGNSAALKTLVSGADIFTGDTVDISINLTWLRNGDFNRIRTSSFQHTPTLFENDHVKIQTCPAQVAGSISIGDMNFTPNPSLDASITLIDASGAQIQ